MLTHSYVISTNILFVFFSHMYFDKNFIEICSRGSDWQLVNFDSGNGLVPSGNRPLPETMLLAQVYDTIPLNLWCKTQFSSQ